VDPGFPILEFDPTPEAVIEPSRVNERLDVPEHCVPCFFRDVVRKVAEGQKARVIAEQKWEHGSRRKPA
jgi:hypothetical protein